MEDNKPKLLTKGFDARKTKPFGMLTANVNVEVFELGFYIYHFENGELIDQTARKTVKKAVELVESIRTKLEKKNYTITDLGHHKVKIDKKTLKFHT